MRVTFAINAILMCSALGCTAGVEDQFIAGDIRVDQNKVRACMAQGGTRTECRDCVARGLTLAECRAPHGPDGVVLAIDLAATSPAVPDGQWLDYTFTAANIGDAEALGHFNVAQAAGSAATLSGGRQASQVLAAAVRPHDVWRLEPGICAA